MRRIAVSIATMMLLGAGLASGATPAGAAGSRLPMHLSQVPRAGVVNVASLPPAVHGAGSDRIIPRRGPSGSPSGPSHAPAGRATAPKAPPTIALGTVLSSPLASSDNPFGLTPPDMGLAVGGGKIVQMVNIVGRIWTGTTPGSVFDLDAFFLATGDAISDPWVQFDAPSGRFIAGIFDITLGGEDMAVSQTSNPGGAWNIYQIQYPSGTVTNGGCPDQGKLGVDDNVIALGFNEFSPHGCPSNATFKGAALEVFNKAEMLAGMTVDFVFTDPLPQYFSMIPAQSMTSTTTERFASVVSGSGTKVHRVTSMGVPPATVTLNVLADITVTTYVSPPQAKQPNTATKLDSGDNRVQHVVWQSGSLALSLTDKCTPAGDAKARACARVISIDTGTSTLQIDTDISKKGHYYIYPAIAVNPAGQIVVVFGDSSKSTFPRVMATALTTGGTATPIKVVNGSQPNTTTRYGDYFAAAIDPSNALKTWVAAEVGGPLTGAFSWNTAVASVKVT